jgi:Protein of unknown function (DUF3631)
MNLEQLAQAIDPKAKLRGNGSWACRCPAHEDDHASLKLSIEDGKLLWHCYGNCSQAAVQAELQKRGLLGKANGADRAAAKTKTKLDDWRPIMPVPEGAPEPGFTHIPYGQPTRTWAYHDADGRLLFHVARFDPPGERKQIIPRCWGTWRGEVGWYWRHPAQPRPLYRLDQLADRPADHVLVVEGEKTADAAAELLPEYVVTTWPGGSSATGMADWSVLKGRPVTIWPDADGPGQKAAEQIGDTLLEIATEIRIVDLPADLPESWDLANPAPEGLKIQALLAQAKPHVDRVEKLVKEAEDDPGAPFEAAAIDFLAALQDRDKAAYERARARLKKAHVRVAALDQELERRKPEAPTDGDAPSKGKALDLPESEPWPESVDGAELIGDLLDQIQHYVILSDHAALTSALWTLHTHAHEAAFHSPRLTLTSPTMRCGKSTLLRTISRLVLRPLPASNITPSAMFRVIEATKPTLLIDEADSFARENEELRGIVNSSHCCLDAYVIRNVSTENDYEPRRFSTWAPMAIASIGKVATTIADRSIMIPMERKAPGQKVARMRADRDSGFGVLASKAARWTADHLDALRSADPDVPQALNDRQADNWAPLLAIADLGGGEWPARARAAALALSEIDEDADTIGIQLLGDIKAVFDGLGVESLWTEDLLRHLHAMSEQPWGEYGRQRKPITPRQLAVLLKPFGIVARQTRQGEKNKNGYMTTQFTEAWIRYLSSTPLRPKESAAHSDFLSSTTDELVEDKNRLTATESAGCRGVEDREGESGPWTGNGQASAPYAPSADWSDVPPDAVLPPGCEIKIDITTGGKQARQGQLDGDGWEHGEI